MQMLSNRYNNLMDKSAFYLDLKFLLDRIFKHQEEAVKKWSTAECSDYQVPLALVTSMLVDCVVLARPARLLNLADRPELQAVRDIIEKSHLRMLLEVDVAANCMRYREGTPQALMEEVADFVVKNSPPAII